MHNVSHETITKLKAFEELLLKWNKHINLIARSTIDDCWNRHILDSLQILDHLTLDSNVVDLGSGGGMPGVILSICGIDNLRLIESDERKCSFLAEAKRKLDLNYIILNERVENLELVCNIITARAYSPIENIMNDTISYKYDKLLLLKGKNVLDEVAKAKLLWNFDYQIIPSALQAESYIIAIKNVKPL